MTGVFTAYFLYDDVTEYTIPSVFSGEVIGKILLKDEEDNYYYDEKSITVKVSTEREYTHHLMDDAELKALFSIKHYNVTVDYDSDMGYVEGAASGIYQYGTVLDLIALPYIGYEFDAWLIDGEIHPEKEHCTLMVNGDISVEALFKEYSPTGIESVDADDLRVRIKLSAADGMMYISGNFSEILMVSIFDMRGAKCLAEQDVEPDEGISVGKLNTGIYFIQVVTDRGIYSAKILKR